MPFAEDFEAAASALDAAAQATGTLIEPARTVLGEGVMVGGQLSRTVSEELDAVGVILDQVSTDLLELAATCRERAEMCRQGLAAEQDYAESYAAYERDLRDWQADHDAQRGNGRDEPPQPPAAPAALPSWANR